MLVSLLVAALPAIAAPPPNRVYVGMSVVPGPAGFGVSGAWESRIGENVWAGVGGFTSPGDLDASAERAREDGIDRFRLRHGFQATLALRVPHTQPAEFEWDVVGRLGGGVAWVTDLGKSGLPDDDALYLTAPAIAGLGGAELQLSRENVGLRVGARAWATSAPDDDAFRQWFMIRPQGLVEASWQF